MPTISQPFVFFSYPGTTEIQLIQGAAMGFKNLEELMEPTFVFSPFDSLSNSPSWAFDASSVETMAVQELEEFVLELPILQQAHLANINHEDYLHFINSLKTTMTQRGIQKTVASRVKSVSRTAVSLIKLFKMLVLKYPQAFVYLALLPNNEVWCGATPEVFAIYQDNRLETMALAGTQKLGERKIEEVVWQKKERDEQKWVQEYIEEILSNASVSWEKGATDSLQAGNLVHIKTHFSASCSQLQVTEIVKKLHPTPAVCGLPAPEAKEILLQAESHQRSYYTGFLGFYSPEKFQLYVNLRCMRIDESFFHLFVGGGITHESDPELEWIETENKALTLESVIR